MSQLDGSADNPASCISGNVGASSGGGGGEGGGGGFAVGIIYNVGYRIETL